MTSAPPRHRRDGRLGPGRQLIEEKKKPQRMPRRAFEFQRGKRCSADFVGIAKIVRVLATAQRKQREKEQKDERIRWTGRTENRQAAARRYVPQDQ